jgi:MFS family permease
MAIASSLTVLGNMLGPVMGGMIAGAFGITATFVVNGVLLLALSLTVSRQLQLKGLDTPAGAAPPAAAEPQE